MLAVNTPYLAAGRRRPHEDAGVIGLSGPYDFLPLKSAKLIDIFGGADPARRSRRSPSPRAAAARRC